MTGQLVSTQTDAWRDDFPGVALRTDDEAGQWQVVQTGAGVVAVAGSNLTVTTGTAVGETIIRSRKSFLGPLRISFLSAALLSQRIAAQEFELRLSDQAGNEVASWLFDGTVSTTGKIRTKTGDAAPLADTSIATLPSSATPVMYEINLAPDEVAFRVRTPDSNVGATAEAIRNRRIPDPDVSLFVEIRVRNTGVAASSTTFGLDAVLVQDVEELAAEIVGGRGGVGAGNAVPTMAVGTTQVSGSAVPVASSSGTGTTTSKVNNAAASIGAAVLKATSGRVYGWHVVNRGAGWAYLRFFDAVAAPAAGASPKFMVPIPPGGQAVRESVIGIPFANGIGVQVTAGPTDTDQTVVANANEVIGSIEWV